MSEPWETLKLLADGTRLRLLRLLAREELSVAELQEILDMGQSRISSHLSILRQGGLLEDRKDGKRTYYSLRSDLPSDHEPLVRGALEALETHPDSRSDTENLERILDKRRRVSEAYFNEIAGRLGRGYCPGRSWQSLGQMLLELVPALDIADLGAGEGIVSQLLARHAQSVVCIDNAPGMVEVGRDLARRQGIENLRYELGDIEEVPLPEGSVDLALLSQALHHARHPEKAVEEAFRILRAGGRVLILDLNQHNFEKAHELYADQWLGFSQNTIYRFLKEAGFENVDVRTVSREEQPPHFETLLAVGRKPAVA